MFLIGKKGFSEAIELNIVHSRVYVHCCVHSESLNPLQKCEVLLRLGTDKGSALVGIHLHVEFLRTLEAILREEFSHLNKLILLDFPSEFRRDGLPHDGTKHSCGAFRRNIL